MSEKIVIICLAVLIATIVCLGYFAFSRIIPKYAIERDAIDDKRGKIIHINGFDIWSCFLNRESRNTPIIVISGGSGLSSDYLEKHMHFLSDNYPILFYDARGCGRSQIKKDLSNYSVSQFADECKMIQEYFFPSKKVIIIAHSFGGIIAMEFAAKYSDSLEKMLLISSPYAKYIPCYTNAFFRIGLPPKKQLDANKWYMEHIEDFLGEYFYSPKTIRIFKETVASYVVIAHVGGRKYDCSKKLKGKHISTLILVGGKKELRISSIDTAKRLQKILPKAEIKQIKNSGHFMFAEAKNEFQTVVNEWINKEKDLNIVLKA